MVEVAGRLEITIAEFEHRCLVHIEELQAQPAPDNALLGLLCDGVRLARETPNLVRDALLLMRNQAQAREEFVLSNSAGGYVRREEQLEVRQLLLDVANLPSPWEGVTAGGNVRPDKTVTLPTWYCTCRWCHATATVVQKRKPVIEGHPENGCVWVRAQAEKVKVEAERSVLTVSDDPLPVWSFPNVFIRPSQWCHLECFRLWFMLDLSSRQMLGGHVHHDEAHDSWRVPDIVKRKMAEASNPKPEIIVAVMDRKTCDFCAAANGQKADILRQASTQPPFSACANPDGCRCVVR